MIDIKHKTDFGRRQLRWDRTGIAFFYGDDREKCFQIFWSRYPRVVYDDGRHNRLVFPSYGIWKRKS